MKLFNTSTLKIIISIYLFILCLSDAGAEESPGKGYLKRLADNTKFDNGKIFLSLNEYDKALLEFNEYIEIFTSGIHRKEALRYIAEIHFREFHYIKSLNSYRSLYEEFSNTREGKEAYLQMGICYIKMGYYEKAKKIFESVIEMSGDPSLVQSAVAQLQLIEIISN